MSRDLESNALEDFSEIREDDIESELAECAEHAAILKEMKRTNIREYRKSLDALITIVVRGTQREGQYAGMGVMTAEAIVLELAEEEAMQKRLEVEEVISTDSSKAFMGNEETFVRLDDAIKSGDLDISENPFE